MMIRGELVGAQTFPARYSNTCWSLIETDDNIKVGGTYEPGGDIIKESSTFVSKPGEPADIRKANYQESIDWYNSIVGDIFG